MYFFSVSVRPKPEKKISFKNPDGIDNLSIDNRVVTTL